MYLVSWRFKNHSNHHNALTSVIADVVIVVIVITVCFVVVFERQMHVYCRWNRYTQILQSHPPAPPQACRGGILADDMVYLLYFNNAPSISLEYSSTLPLHPPL